MQTENGTYSAALFGRTGFCARALCGEPLPARSGPGRPRRFCSKDCSGQAARESRTARRSIERSSRPQPRQTRFGQKLREAIAHSGLSLEAISAKLFAEDGVHVSPGTLSNWQRGRPPRRPPRHGDDEDGRISALERILGLRRGDLLLLLDQEKTDRPTAALPTPSTRQRTEDEEMRELRAHTGLLGGPDGYFTTAVDERLLVGADRKPHLRIVRQTVLAVGDYVDCAWLFYSPDGEGITTTIRPVRPLRQGRYIPWRNGLAAAEFLFGRTLARGESHTFEYHVEEKHVGQPLPVYRRVTGQTDKPPVERLKMTVEFAIPPRQVRWCKWEGRRAAPTVAEPIPLVNGVAGRLLTNPVPGMYGLSWTW